MKKLFIAFIFLISLFFMGCSDKTITVNTTPNCKLPKKGAFIIQYYQLPNKSLIYGGSNIPSANLQNITYNVYKEFLKEFSKNKNYDVILYNNYSKKIIASNHLYHKNNPIQVIISGTYKTLIGNSSTPVTTFHSGQFFNGFTSNGTYYYGNTLPSTSTTWIPTQTKYNSYVFRYDVIINNQNKILEGFMKTFNYNDAIDKDWIDKGIERLKKCLKN